MEMLNVDCLLDIFKLLDLKDQISVLQVCQQFKRVIKDIWQYEYRNVQLNLLEALLDTQQFQHFVENICETTEVFRLKFLTRNKFEILKQYQFLNAHDFRFSQMQPFFMKDEDIISISHIFPNLLTFSPYGGFSGEYMLCLKQLKSLTLKHCYKLNTYYLRKLLKGLRLKSLTLDFFYDDIGLLGDAFGKFCELEEIVLNSQELVLILSEKFMKSTHMKKLAITEGLDDKLREKFFSFLLTYKAHDVLAVETCDIQIWPEMIPLGSYTNLRKLTFSRNFDIFRRIGHHIKSLPELRELYFDSCVVIEIEILDLLKGAKQLDCLSLSNCQIDVEYLVIDIQEIAEGRCKVLTLNFYKNISNSTEKEAYVWLKIIGKSDLFRNTNDDLIIVDNALTFTFR